ncbi:hypothetical protein MASR2M79_21410 [Aminivibrio sp.]
MVGPSQDLHFLLMNAHDRPDDTEVYPLRFEDRPLFYMHFHEGSEASLRTDCLFQAAGVESGPAHGLSHGDSVPVAGGKFLRADLAGHRPAAEEASAETAPFFLHEGGKFDGKLGLNFILVQEAGDLKGHDDPGGAVEITPVLHRIKMGSHHDRRGVRLFPLPASEKIARSVLKDREPGLPHPFLDKLPCFSVLFREGKPCHAHPRSSGEFCQAFDIPGYSLGARFNHGEPSFPLLTFPFFCLRERRNKFRRG